MLRIQGLGAVACVVGGGALLLGQTASVRPAFEVVSIHQNLINDPRDPRYNALPDYLPRLSGDRISMRKSRLASIVSWAYHLTNRNYQLIAGPWQNYLWDDYDIEARAPGSPNDDDLRQMFQTLLESRFRLRVHRETREMPAYDLVVAKGGSKLTPAPARAVKHSIGDGGSSSWVELTGNGGLVLVGVGASMEELAVVLTGKMDAPVRDRTGLAGAFDYRVAFSSGIDASDAPVLTTAIRDLGLTLARSRGAFEVLVIDHVDKPTAN